MLYPVSRERAEHRCGLLTNSMFASSSRAGAQPSSIIRSMGACASRTLEIVHRGTRIVNYSRRALLFPYREQFAVPPSRTCGNNWAVSPGNHAKRKPSNQRVRGLLFPLFRWWLCSAATPKQHQTVLGSTKTRVQKPVPAIPTQ